MRMAPGRGRGHLCWWSLISAIRFFSQTTMNAHTISHLIKIRMADPPIHTQRIAVIINIFRVDPLEFFRYISTIILYKNAYRLIDNFIPQVLDNAKPVLGRMGEMQMS